MCCPLDIVLQLGDAALISRFYPVTQFVFVSLCFNFIHFVFVLFKQITIHEDFGLRLVNSNWYWRRVKTFSICIYVIWYFVALKYQMNTNIRSFYTIFS